MLLNMIIWLYLDTQPLLSLFWLLFGRKIELLQKLLITAFVMTIPISGFAQEVQMKYTLYNKSDKVGTIHFIHNDNNTKEVFRMQMKVRVNLKLFAVNLCDEKEAVYNNGTLESAFVIRRLQEKTLNKKETLKTPTGYSNGQNQIIGVSDAIHFSSLQLFITEPDSGVLLYSEGQQIIVPVVEAGPHHYRVDLPDGHSNEYFYRNGICYKIIATTQWATVTALLNSE